MLAAAFLLLAALPAQSAPLSAARDSETVVFVCEHGTVKSVVAMAWFGQLARARQLPVRAISRGTAPDPSVPPAVSNGLRGDGLALGAFTPTPFTPVDLGSAIAVVSFDQPGVAATVAGRVPTQTWDNLPAVSENYAAASLAIRNRVAHLVDSLAGRRQGPNWAAVDSAMGRSAVTQPGGIHRYNFPRSDLTVMVGSVKVLPALALGGWVAFAPDGEQAFAMGDLVLTTDELAPVLAKLQQGGVEQSAIHHHLVGETPRVLYVHVHAHGDPVAIAKAVRAAVALTKIPAPTPAAAPPPLALDTAAIAGELGRSGRLNGAVYQVSVPRAETIKEGGFTIPSALGLGTAINFQPTADGKAAITGDFVLLASEVNPVIRALSENGISPTSLHNHLLSEEPRLFFVHFWAEGDARALARGLRAALDKTNSAH